MSIEPTDIKPTEIKPTNIKLGRFIKPFSIKGIYSDFGLTLVGSLLMFLGYTFADQNKWMFLLLGLMLVLTGFSSLIQETLKLPIKSELIAELNSKLAPGKPSIDINKLSLVKKISYRAQSAQGVVKVLPPISIVTSLLGGIVSLTASLSGGVALINTSITGRWQHELKSVPNESTWVMNVSMWNVTGDDEGMLYMNVEEAGTFTIEYNSAVVAYGEWNKDGVEYAFLHHDPDDVLASLWENYRIRGNHLYIYG